MLLQRQVISLIVRNIDNNFSVKFSKRSAQFPKMYTPITLNSVEHTNNCTKSLVAISQMRSTNDKSSAMQQVEQLIDKAKAANATFLFLPECCDFVGQNRQETIELSEPLTGPTMQRYQILAKENKLWLSLGGIHEAIEATDTKSGTTCKTEHIYNSHVIINDYGDIVGVYRKLHLFDVDTPEFRFQESKVVSPGKELIMPFNTPIGHLGLQICYDMRFPEASLLLRKAGAQILTYPSAFSYMTGKAHWETLLRARAIENQCFVLAPAQVGYHNSKRRSWGHAMAVSPWGKVLANCDCEEDPTIATIEIDLSSIIPIRANMPCFQHRRDDIYSLTAYGFGTTEPHQDYVFATNIIRKETIFYETQHSFAFTNLRCVVKGHVLVSTKRVTSRLSGLACNEMTDLFTTVCTIQRMLESFYKTTSATVTVQDGIDAGQTVPHVHFHVMPRRPGDFGHNDQIYVKLEDRCEGQPPRNITERIEEAQMYREYLKRQQ